MLEFIKGRRSIRQFQKKSVPSNLLDLILDAGRWAPSGLNNQPWRFMIIEGDQKDNLAQYTKYSHIVKSSDKAILIFLDKDSSYNYEKDLMAIGACIQNMLLCIHANGLGACWLGEILNQREKVNKAFKINKNLELQAVIALGYPQKSPPKGNRKSLKSLMV